MKVTLAPGGTVKVDLYSSRGLSEGATSSELAAVMVASALGQSGITLVAADPGALPGGIQRQEEVAQVVEAELASMSALMEGRSVAEHLEPDYLQSMRAAIDSHFTNEV